MTKEQELYLLQQYKLAQDELIAKMYKTFDKVGQNGAWDWNNLNKFGTLQQLYKDIESEIKQLGGKEEKNLKDVLTKDYQNGLGKGYLKDWELTTKQSYEDLAKKFGLDKEKGYDPRDYYKILTSIYEKNKTGLGYKFNKPNMDNINAIINHEYMGDTFSDRIWKDKTLLLNNIKNEITHSAILGENPRKTAQRIKTKVGNTAYNSLRLARTESARMQNQGMLDSIKDRGYEKVSWNASYKACEKCQDLEKGSPYLVKDLPFLIAHPNCTCAIAPFIDEKEILGKLDKPNMPEGETITSADIKNTLGIDTSKPKGNVDLDNIQDFYKKSSVYDSNIRKADDVDYWVNSELGIDIMNAGFKGMNVDIAKDFANSMYELRQRYDKVFTTNMQGMGTFKKYNQLSGRKSRNSGTYAFYVHGRGDNILSFEGIYFTSAFKSLNSLINSYKTDLAAGYHPEGTTYKGIFYHEFGHTIHTYMKRNKLDGELNNIFKDVNNGKYGEVKDVVSRYACESVEELVAEAFCEYLESPNPRPLAIDIGRAIDKALNKKPFYEEKTKKK